MSSMPPPSRMNWLLLRLSIIVAGCTLVALPCIQVYTAVRFNARLDAVEERTAELRRLCRSEKHDHLPEQMQVTGVHHRFKRYINWRWNEDHKKQETTTPSLQMETTTAAAGHQSSDKPPDQVRAGMQEMEVEVVKLQRVIHLHLDTPDSIPDLHTNVGYWTLEHRYKQESVVAKLVDDNTGRLNITEAGTYLVYAQVKFRNKRRTNGFIIKLQRNSQNMPHNLVRCYSGAANTTNITQHRSCYTSRVAELSPGDLLHMSSVYHSSSVSQRPADTYWGVMCLDCQKHRYIEKQPDTHRTRHTEY